MVSQVVKSVAVRVQRSLLMLTSTPSNSGMDAGLITLITLFSAWENSFASTVAFTPLSSFLFFESLAEY